MEEARKNYKEGAGRKKLVGGVYYDPDSVLVNELYNNLSDLAYMKDHHEKVKSRTKSILEANQAKKDKSIIPPGSVTTYDFPHILDFVF